jgi:arsenate reductase
MDDRVKGIRSGRPAMRGSSKLGPRTPVPTPPPFDSGNPAQASAARGVTNPVSRQSGAFPPVARRPIGARPDGESVPAQHPGVKKRVLFVCIGNSCRSQMAEAFARAYGGDAIIASSAGLSPASIIAPLTRKVLTEKNIAIGDQFPKGIEMASREPFDIVVNMSGLPLTMEVRRAVNWQVQDPIGHEEAVYRRVAAQIEELVMRLILDLRAPAK